MDKAQLPAQNQLGAVAYGPVVSESVPGAQVMSQKLVAARPVMDGLAHIGPSQADPPQQKPPGPPAHNSVIQDVIMVDDDKNLVSSEPSDCGGQKLH